jgi:hypothetical protein
MTAATATSARITSYGEFLMALLSNRELFFEEVVDGARLGAKLRYGILTVVALAGFFGAVAGAYSGPFQAVSAAIKLPLLFFATFLVCFPAFFVVQVLVGSRLQLRQVVVLVVGALALTSIVLAALVPITAVFLITGANYYFQHLLNIAIAVIAGAFGMYWLHDGLTLVCEKRGVYPRKAITIMRVWALLFGFVGVQLAWNLRPFLGDRNQSFQVFGNYQGNFYTAVIYALRQLLEAEPARHQPPTRPLPLDSVLPRVDTAGTTRSRP